MPPTSTDISLPTGFVRRSHTVAQRPGIHTSSPPSRLQLKTTGKWCTNTLTLSLRWGRSVCATNPVLFPKIPPQDRAAVAHRGNSLKNTPYFAPTLCTSSFPSWCFGDPFPNTPLTLNSCLRDCVWGGSKPKLHPFSRSFSLSMELHCVCLVCHRSGFTHSFIESFSRSEKC